MMSRTALRVWRVCNGWQANGPVHRVVVAPTPEEAIAYALAAGMETPPHGGKWSADPVCLAVAGACEEADYD